MRRFLSSLWAALHRHRFESEMQREMQDHLTARADELVASGISRDQAEAQARREFGAVGLVQDECRDSQGLAWIDGLLRDFRFAFRILRKSPGFTCTAILILTLCIGANTTIFSVVDAALFRALPYPEPERLVTVVKHARSARGEYEGDSQDGKTWEYLRDHVRLMDLAVTAGAQGVNLGLSASQAVYVQQHRVSTGYFRVLGITPLIGREFDPVEDRAGGPPVAILSESLWRDAFGAERSIIGRSIRLRGELFTVVGVMPAEFVAIPKADVWTPLRPSTTGEGNGANYQVVGRVRAGVPLEQANAELRELSAVFYAEEKLPPGVTVELKGVGVQRAWSAQIRMPMLLLWAAVGLVLLIGCVNIAGLILAKGNGRQHEICTRMALGSSRAAIARQLMVESLLIATLGGLLGLALGFGAIASLGPALTKSIGLIQQPQLDARVALLALTAAFATTIFFGLYPAWRLTGLDVRRGLAKGGRTSSIGYGFARSVLVVSQLALGVMLLAGAGLVLRTLSYLMHLDPGFDGRNVIAGSLSLQDARYATPESVSRLFDATLERLRALPDVEAAGVALTVPYERALNDQAIVRDGKLASNEKFTTNLVYVTPGFLEALHVRTLSGRLLEPQDQKNSEPVAIVNEAFAKRYLREDDPIGRHLNYGRVIGVISDTQQRGSWGNFGPLGPIPTVYVAVEQFPEPLIKMVHQWFSPKWVVRTRGPAPDIAAEMKRAVASVDPLLPFEEFRSMDEMRASSMEFQRVESVLFATLAGLALLLAAVGMFGLIAQAVAERTREFGIRMALGSSAGQVISGTVGRGLALAVVGGVIGTLLALGAGRVMRSLLWGVRPNDPLVFSVVVGVLLAVVGLASFLPSLKIARINPAETLRSE